jgi:hypothetical protein
MRNFWMGLFILAILPASSGAEGSFSGLKESAREEHRIQFEETLRDRVTTAIKPFVSDATFFVTVKISLFPKQTERKQEVSFSKFGFDGPVAYAPSHSKSKSFYDEIRSINIAIAHDNRLSEQSMKSVSTLAKQLVPLVAESRITVSSLQIDSPVVQKKEPTPFFRIVGDKSIWDLLRDFQFLIGAMIALFAAAFVYVFGIRRMSETIVALVDTRAQERTAQARSQAAPPLPIEYPTRSGQVPDTKLSRKLERWLVELSPEQLAECTRKDVKFGVALSHVAGEGRTAGAMGAMSRDMIEAVTHALLMWRFDQLEAYLSHFEAIVAEVHTPMAEPSFEKVERVAYEAAQEGESDVIDLVGHEGSEVFSMLPPEVTFALPAAILTPAFASLAPEMKIVLLANLQHAICTEFMSKVVPREGKMAQFLSYELERVRSDVDAQGVVKAKRLESLLAFTQSVRTVIDANSKFKSMAQPFIDEWKRNPQPNRTSKNDAA